MEQNEEIFNENSSPKKDKDLLKKLIIALTFAAVVIFIIMSNCNNKKRTTTSDSIAPNVNATESEVDVYEKEMKRNSGIQSDEDTWKKDSSGLINTLSTSMSNNYYDPNNARPQINQNRYEAENDQSQYDGPLKPTVSSAPYKYTAPSGMKKRLDPEFQAVVSHFQGIKKYSWSVAEEEFNNQLKGKGDLLNPVEKPLKDLYGGADKIKSNLLTRLPAGTRIIAQTDQDISSDHPGAFTASIVRPFEVKGLKLICQSGTNQRDRIPVTITKVISSEDKELSLDGQVQMGFPGLEGSVKNHWPQRVVPGLVSAAIGGGASLYLLNSSTPNSGSTSGGNISTRDLIAGPLLEGATQSLQNEVSRFGGDYPNTVTVKAGTQFEILVTSEVAL